jgi:hypothetical protein
MVAYVVDTLLNHGFLVMKPSNGHKKFALNPDRRVELLKCCGIVAWRERCNRFCHEAQQPRVVAYWIA